MKPPLWLILHAAAHASMASKEQLFLLVTEPRSGSDWFIDLLDAHPKVCVPAGRWAEKGSGDKHNGIDGHALVGVAKAKTLNASGADVGAAYEAAADYRLAHPLRGPKDDAGIRHRKACTAFGWKQPMHMLVPTYQLKTHVRATIDRDSFYMALTEGLELRRQHVELAEAPDRVRDGLDDARAVLLYRRHFEQFIINGSLRGDEREQRLGLGGDAEDVLEEYSAGGLVGHARVHDLLPGALYELDRFREICAGVEWDGKRMYELSSNDMTRRRRGGSAAVKLDDVEPRYRNDVALTALRAASGGRAKLHDQASKLLQMWHDTGRAALQLHGV